MLRIAITGPESTGKTTLAVQLAEHYKTSFAPEFAREYLSATGPHYTLDDLEEIARGQLEWERSACEQARRIVFCDTDLLVIKIWAEHAFGYCPPWITQHLEQHPYDFTLLMGIDLPWQSDPLREHPHPQLRQHFFDLYRRELRERMTPFAEITGLNCRRVEQAVYLIDGLLADMR